MSKRDPGNGRRRPALYPVKRRGKTRYVNIPGAGAQQPVPGSGSEWETFLAEALETYAETSDMVRPRIRTLEEAGGLTHNRGLVVGIGDAEYQLIIVRSR